MVSAKANTIFLFTAIISFFVEISQIERMSTGTDFLFAVDVDMIPFFRC